MKKRTDSGITLLALVLTLIVLLVLVAVVLKFLGDDGIIARARWANYVEEYEKVDEQKEMYMSAYKMDKLIGNKSKVLYQYKVAATDYWGESLDEKLLMYPISEEVDVSSVPETLLSTLQKNENLTVLQLTNTDYVNLYKVDFEKLDMTAKKEYVVNLASGILYSLDAEMYKGDAYHIPRLTMAGGEIDTKISEPGTYEFIFDAETVAEWASVELFYEEYIEDSVTCEFYVSDDSDSWEEITSTSEVKEEVVEEEFTFGEGKKTRYLKVVINIEENTSGETAEINYLLVNYHQYNKRDVKLTLEEVDTEKINGIYVKGTVSQTFTVPSDGEHIANAEVYGNPNITVTITHNGTTQNLTWDEFKNTTLAPGATVTVTATIESDSGDGIGPIQVLQKDSTPTSKKINIVKEKEEKVEWTTVKEKQFIYNNRGVGAWNKCYFNSTIVGSDGIIEVAENKRVKITYQKSSNAESWGSRFSNVKNGGTTQYLKVNVEYQVYGNISYGTIGNDKVIVLRNLDVEDVTEGNATYNVTWSGANGTVNISTTTGNYIELSTNGTNWDTKNSITVPSNTKLYVRFKNEHGYTGEYTSITIIKTSAVKYDANGSGDTVTDMPEDTTATHTQTVTVDFTTTPKRAGYKFLGYSTDKNAETATYTNETGKNTFKMGTEDVTLYAIWRMPIYVDSITLNKTDIALANNGTFQLQATVNPSNADDTSVTWSSSNTGIATVSSTGLVKVVTSSETSATITCTANDGTGKKAVCRVFANMTGISTRAQLAAIPDGATGYYVLLNNINLSGSDWTPICTSTGFKGTFNGNGYKLSNISIAGDRGNLGLFSLISGATIKNLKIDGFTVSHQSGNAGAVAGKVQGSSIIECVGVLNLNMTKTKTGSGADTSGGLTGYGVSTQTIRNCYVRGSITGPGTLYGHLCGLSGYHVTNIYTSYSAITSSGIVDDPIEDMSLASNSNCYYNSDIYGGRLSSNSVKTGLTTAQFANSSNFSGWDFTNTWTISNGYPELRIFLQR